MFCLGDVKALIAQCKQCIASIQSTDQIIPRQEIIEHCTAFLLNMCEWDYLASLEKRSSYCEFASAISLVCQDIAKFKGLRKFPKEPWDMGKINEIYLSFIIDYYLLYTFIIDFTCVSQFLLHSARIAITHRNGAAVAILVEVQREIRFPVL